MSETLYEIRVSRLVIFIKLLLGLIFISAGLELAFPDMLYPLDIPQERIRIFHVMGLFGILIGLTIAVAQTLYFVRPPIMLRATSEGVYFATGRFYRPAILEWRHLESVSVSSGPATSASYDQPSGSLQLIFRSDLNVPCSLKTPAGLSYSNYVLTLNSLYMNKPVDTAVAAIKAVFPKTAL